jgi:hypothetical protein
MLVQAAQRVGTHPGPVGAFFRRLSKRKNRSVAVVATARKLVVIAWHMLRNNEPYRYAQPATTSNSHYEDCLSGSTEEDYWETRDKREDSR